MLDYLSDPRERSWCRRLRQGSHDGLVEAINQARAGVGYQPDIAGLPRLEVHGSSRRNIQAKAHSSPPVESESGVGLGEMIMTADLDRSVACVGDLERHSRSVLVEDNLAGSWKNLA